MFSKVEDSHQSMTDRVHRHVCDKAFKKAECIYLSETHVERREKCKLTDMLNVPDAQMRRLSRWDFSRIVTELESPSAPP